MKSAAVPDTQNAQPLAELPRGGCATIVRIDDDAAVDRLAGLGFCVGRLVEMVQHGDPMIVRACGARVGLARALGNIVHVTPCPDECAIQNREAPA